MPDPSWPTPPRGWSFWTVAEQDAEPGAATALAAYGTDRGSWLADLRARAASGVLPSAAAGLVVNTVGETAGQTADEMTADTGPQADAAGGEWALDGLLTSAVPVEP